MNRAIILLLVLSVAAVGYAVTELSRDRGTVVTVAQRSADTAPRPAIAPPPHKPAAAPGDRAALARDLQRELKRVGCYDGEISGIWTTSSRVAMQSFTERVNAKLPIDQPDAVLLSLVRGHQGRACGAACPAGQAATEDGRCLPSASLAAAPRLPAPAAAEPEKSPAPPEKADAATSTWSPTAAAPALVVPPVVARKADPSQAAVTPPPAPLPAPAAPAAAAARPERTTGTSGGPVPPVGVYERGARRSGHRARSRPPRMVRKLLRNFERAIGLR